MSARARANPRLAALAILFSTTTLVACGGGGGSSPTPPPPPPPAPRWTVSVAAGVSHTADISTFAAPVDGAADIAVFSSLRDVTLAPDHRLYITDERAGRIRTLATGQVSTYVGPAVSGGGSAGYPVADFGLENFLAVDSAGDVFGSYMFRQVVRRYAPGLGGATMAGQLDVVGFADGDSAHALFNYPAGIVRDSHGKLWVADSGNNAIRGVDGAGRVTTLAGGGPGAYGHVDGAGAAAKFGSPFYLAIDGSDTLFVGEVGVTVIRKVTPEGVVTTLAGDSTHAGLDLDGTGTQARFAHIGGIAVDGDGTLYVTDGHLVRQVTAAGVVTTIADLGSGDLHGIAVDIDGSLVVADVDGNQLLRLTRSR